MWWVALWAVAREAHADYLAPHSFVPPFIALAPKSMKRAISDDWASFGDAEVFQSFTRLTPSRSRSVGAIWSNRDLGESFASSDVEGVQLSVVFKFRVSGPSDAETRGEGIALWVAFKPNTYKRGAAFGFTDTFTGVGVLFDTRANVARVVVSDAERPGAPAKSAQCDVAIRSDSRRADFDFRNATRVRLIVSGARARVLIDPHGTNKWALCGDVQLHEITAPRSGEAPGYDWLRSARIGVTAATGTSSDQHDVISLESFSSVSAHDGHLNKAWKKFLTGEKGVLDSHRYERAEDMINWMTFKLEHMTHVHEHATADFKAAIADTVEELESILLNENEKLDLVDSNVDKTLTKALEKRLDKLQAKFDAACDSRIVDAGSDLSTALESKVDDGIQAFANSWKQPFQLLVAAHILLFFVAFLAWKRLRSERLL